MTIHQQRIQEVKKLYQNNDINLGFRRLIDTALDTGKISILKEIITFTNWKYNQEKTTEQEVQKAIDLLQKIEKLGINIKNTKILNLIQAKQISKEYVDGKFKLEPLNLSLKTSEIIGLVGENGNGKTTLLRVLASELKPTTGSINYQFSNKIKNTYNLRTKLVYIPQRIETMRGTLMDNLQFTLSSHGIFGEANFYLAQTMLARMGLWNYKDHEWKRLSSGYKMRFELARTLLRKPEVLLLDEPLANLDILAQQNILEDLRYLSASLQQPFGIVLSSQQLYEVEKISDKIIFLNQGKLINDSSIIDDNKPELDKIIIELDTNIKREELEQQLKTIGLLNLNYNGGNYIAEFPNTQTISNIMYTLGKQKIPVTYLRDISKSSRRFFID